jgi:predicted transcriptional regulator
MGFPRVNDYVAGKKDWGSYGLPHEGTNVPDPLAGDVAHREVPICGLADRLADVQKRVQAAGWDTCIVVNEQRVVLGRLGRKALGSDADASVEEAMTPGPSTVRPSFGLDEAVQRMQAQDLTSLPVTRSDGVLVGVLRREDAERTLARSGGHSSASAGP